MGFVLMPNTMMLYDAAIALKSKIALVAFRMLKYLKVLELAE
jgi:hypothetical protein